ncbi:hypothetical protein ACJJTC_006922 [Scirpophaga incertulas]
MEETRGPKIYPKYDYGLRNSFYQNTAPYPPLKAKFTEVCYTPLKRNVHRNKKNAERGSYRESDWGKRDTKILAAQRFPVQNRYFSCLSPCANKKKSSPISNSQLRRNLLSNDLPADGLSQCATSFLKDHKLGGKHSSGKRNEGNRLSGRFSYRPSTTVSSSEPGRERFEALNRVRLEHKLEQINRKANKVSRVSRGEIQYRKKLEESSKKQGDGFTFTPRNYGSPSEMELGPRDVLTRKAPVCSRGGSLGSTLLSKFAKGESEVGRVHSKEFVSPASRSRRRMPLVANQSKKTELNNRKSTKLVCNNRCLGLRMGDTTRPIPPVRIVDFSSKPMAHKYERTIRSLHSLKKISTYSQEQGSYDSGRQSHHDCISTKPGRHEISKVVPLNEENTSICKQNEYASDPILHTREIQHHSRSIIPQLDGNRLAPTRRHNEEDIQPVGIPADRPIRDSSIQSCASVCLHRCNRPTSILRERIQQELGIRSSVGFPSATIDSQGYSTSELRKRNIHDSGAQMAESVLAGSAQEYIDGGTNRVIEPCTPTDRPRHTVSSPGGNVNDFGGLESSGWNNLVSNLPGEDVELLTSAWRHSTWKTYTGAWKGWVKWCKEKDFIPNDPSPHQVASYLSYLFRIKKLAYNTILVRKSVIATFTNPESVRNVGAHPIVRAMLKAISIKLSEKSSPRSQVWNL